MLYRCVVGAAVALLAVALGVSAPAFAQDAPPPPSVRAQVAEDVQQCRAAGQQWEPPADYVQRGDFNGDGRPDFLIARSSAQCGPAFCGPDGCRFDTFISQTGGSFLRAYGMTEGSGTVGVARGSGGRDVLVRSNGARLGWSGREWAATR